MRHMTTSISGVTFTGLKVALELAEDSATHGINEGRDFFNEVREDREGRFWIRIRIRAIRA